MCITEVLQTDQQQLLQLQYKSVRWRREKAPVGCCASSCWVRFTSTTNHHTGRPPPEGCDPLLAPGSTGEDVSLSLRLFRLCLSSHSAADFKHRQFASFWASPASLFVNNEKPTGALGDTRPAVVSKYAFECRVAIHVDVLICIVLHFIEYLQYLAHTNSC